MRAALTTSNMAHDLGWRIDIGSYPDWQDLGNYQAVICDEETGKVLQRLSSDSYFGLQVKVEWFIYNAYRSMN